MRSFKYWILVLMIFICREALFPQTLNELESVYEKSQYNLKKETAELDSLRSVLNARINKINMVKNKADYNKEYAAGLMSGSILISNQIDSLQNKIESDENSNEKIKIRLSAVYGAQIDSLQKIEKAGKVPKGKLNDIKSRIYILLEKRIFTAPGIKPLTFYPDKIARVNPDTVKDPEQRKIYREYFVKALREITDRLNKVDESYNEVHSIITLRKKTSRFLEETEFQSLPPQTVNEQSTTENYGSPTAGRGTPNSNTDYATAAQKSSYLMQAQDYNLLLWQLKQPFDSNNKITPSRISSDLTYTQYFEMLKELKERLSEYKLLLSHKAGID